MAIVHFVNYKRGTQSRAAMRGVMLYVMQEKKTAWEGVPLVSGVNCQPQSVYDDFLNTKLLYHKDGGMMFYHMVQSFPKGAAVDPRQAHEAVRRLAEYFDGCEVLVCTHVDREHIHSHCVINSVNFETGKKLHMAKEQIQELMRRNDAICLEMGLPVFEAAAQKSRGMSGAEYHTALKGQSWKLRLMNTIDECMKYATDKDAFASLMASEGYQVRWENNRKYITYTTPDGMRCRDSKLHEEKYCKEAMEHEFRIRAKLVQRKFHRAEETDGGIEADESAEQRAAGWVQARNIVRSVTPEMLVDREVLLHSPFVSQPPVQGAIALTLHRWPWGWGVTGSTGYALATEIPVLHAASDLDLLIRAPQPLDREALLEWQTRVAQLPCRADTQVETPYGAFALNEWLRDGRALLKTSRGARLTATPWHREE